MLEAALVIFTAISFPEGVYVSSWCVVLCCDVVCCLFSSYFVLSRGIFLSVFTFPFVVVFISPFIILIYIVVYSFTSDQCAVQYF